MKKDAFEVTPWEVSGSVDYNKLIKDFGVEKISENLRNKLKDTHPLLKRGVYFAHREFDKWVNDHEKGKTVSVVTGRGPSERMHIGHLVPFLVVKSLQDTFGCNVFLAISDDEKFYVKEKLDYEQVLEYGKENILDIIALGFDSKKTFIFQDLIHTNIYKHAARCAKRMTYSMAKATFGLKPENNIGWSFYPAVQAAHILFPQFIGKNQRTVVPVGIDQDPFVRLTRDIANHQDFKFEKPAGLYAKFIPNLQGAPKMGSSESGVIFLTDSPKEVETKIKKYAFSGGQDTIEEHRKKGGNPDVDVSFQYLKYLFEPDDKKLKKIHDDYKSGKMLTSELKQILIDKINVFLKEHQKKRELAEKQLDKFIYKG